MVTNFDVVRGFNCGMNKPIIKTQHLFYEDNILYSYGGHFPLCIKLLNGYVVNSNSYSQTTAQHKGILIREITDEDSFKEFEKVKKDYPNIVLMDTNQIKHLIDDIKLEEKKIETIEDLKNFMMLGELEE